MAFLDDLKKKANQTVQSYANSAEGQKRLSEYNASNTKKSTVSSVKNTVRKTFQPITDLASKAMPKTESNWYKGSKPTQRETLARIYEVGNQDPSKRDSLMQMYQAELSDPASPIYNPYTSATTTSLSKTNLNNTLKAQQEWEELTKELAWWAQHPSRNYSDDEIISRVDWSKYKTLQTMDAGRESGSPYALTDAVGYSKDAMYGVLWAARNPNKSTGDYMLDAVQSVLGRGKQYQPDEKTANRLNPKSKEYNPYAVGGTMDELAYKYGVYSFDQEWLDNNRHLIANPDTNADYGKIYKAVQNTAAMNAEAQSFNNDVARLLEAGQPVDVDKIIERGEYSQLQKIRESLDSGQRIDTTAAIDFDPYLLQTDADAYLQQVTGDYTTDQYDQMLSDNMGGSYLPNESKQNSEELRKLNTDVNLPEYISVATEPELRAFKTTANAGYSDVVYTTTDLIANGTGGLAQANAAQQKAAHAFANKNLFDAWDAINDDVSFADAMPDDVAAFLQKYFPEKYEAGELPTMYEVATLDMSNHPGEDLNNVVATWNEMYEYAEAAMEDTAGRKDAADKARQTVADVMDDLAEVYGEGTDQYNAAVATYEMAYAYTRGVPKVWRAYDAYQDASAEGPITKEYGDYVLKNQRGANARDILVLNALIENAEIIGIPEADIRNMRQQVEDLKTQNDLLAAHKLSSNEDYASQVAAFDAQFPKADGMNLFGQKFSTHEDAVRQAVADPEYGFFSLTTDANPTEITMLAQAMTDEERNNYKYIYVTEGQERATAYFDALSENLYVRAAEERSERTQEWAAENELNSAIATVGSVFLTPMEAASALSMMVEFVQTGKVNPYGMNAVVSQMKGDLRTGAKEGAKAAWGEENKVAYAIYSTIYDALTSAADSMVASKFGSIGGAAMMGASAFNSATMDASMRGASAERALLFGAASALIEAGSEKISIDRILGAFDSGASGVRGLLDEIAKGFFSEGAEEMASTLGSAIADDMIMGAMANRETAIAAYMEAGLTREEAEAQAAKDILTDIAYSGLVGGISGSFSSGLEYGRGSLTGTTEQPVQTPEETTQGTTQEAAPTGTPVQRAEAALSTAMQEGVGEVQQTATMAGVLQSFGLSDMEANAAAKNIVGATNIRVLRKMLSQADDPAGLIQAIAMGSVSERSRSWAILHNARVDSKNAKEIGEQLISAYNEDANDQSVMTEYDARVAFDAEADATADIIASSGRVDTSAFDKAKEQSTNAQLEMDKAEAEVEAAHQAVVEAQDRFNANPSDDKAKQALKNAINLQYKARERSEAAKRNAILAKKNLAKINADFKAQTAANMVAAREQAMQNVGQQVQEIQAKRVDAATEKADAMYGYSDEARADILAEKRLTVSEMPEPDRQVTAKDIATLEQSKKRDAVKYISGLLEKFGIFKKYNNQDADIEFEFTKSGLNESANKQADRGGDYISFAKMLVNLDALVANAVPVETHTDKYVGTRREDQQLERVYVLLSAFRDGDSVVPVQFEIKEFRDKENKLYVAVSLKKTEAADLHAVPSVDEASATTASSFEEAGRGADTSPDAKSTTASSDISIPELIQKINPEDGDFLKYIPDSMLSNEQKQSKMKALEKERAKIEKLRNENNSVVTNAERRSELQRTQIPPQTVRGNQSTSSVIVNPVRSARKLAWALGIGERIGTRKMNNVPRAVLGYYNNRARYLAVRPTQAGNITVNMHEIGHAVSQRLNMTGTPQMVANLPAVFAQNYAAQELPGEAFAEFMWRYMADDAQAEAFAGPGFIYQFEQALRRAGIADAVHAARDEMHAYVNATVNDRIGSMVVDRSQKERTPIKEWFTKALSGFADSTAALEQIDSDIRSRSDDGLDPDESLRDAALMRNTADRRAWNILTGSLTDSNWNIVGDSLATVIERTGMEGADFDLLNNYMLALHSIDREAQGLPVFDDSISFSERQNFISDVEQNHYNVARAAEEIHNWWHNFMQLFMVDTGYLTQDTLDRFEQMYPHYVPTNRVKKKGARRNGEGGSTYTVRRATGSTEEIYNPMDTIVQNVNTIVKMVSQNNVGLVFDQLYQQYEGLGIYARNVTEDMRLSRVDTTTLRDEIEYILTQAQTDQDAMEEVLDLIGNEQTQWRATGNVNLPNVMQVRMPNGTQRFYEFSDNEIFKAVSGLKEQHANSLLDWLGRMTRSMSALTTGSNPLFSIRNFMRDFQKSVNYGSWATSYVDGMAKWVRAAYEVWREGGEYEQYKALGGGGWTRIDANTRKGADEYRGELFRGYNTSNVGRTVKWAGKKVWNAITLSRLNEVVEQASRYAEYRFGQQDKTTEAGRQKAFLNAQEATVDFNRTGNSQVAHDLKMIVPFFNASVQGVYQTGREFLSESERGRLPARFAKTVLNTAITSALASGLMLKFMDDEDKEEFLWLSDDLKSDHFYIPNFFGGDAPLIRIPLAQDPLSRAVHGWITNMMWNNEGADEPAIELSAIVSNILDGFNPVSGTVWDPILAMSTNKNWYGSNIVPSRMQNWHPTTQYTEETAELFVKAGQVLGISPLMLEYMAEQYTGFLGQIVIPAISKNEFTGEMQGVSAVISEARKKMTSDPLLSNNITSAFYDSADMFEQIKAAATNSKEQYWLNRKLSDDEARAAVDEAEAMLKSGGIISDTKKLISEAYNRIDAVNANPDLTDHEKYVQTSEIRREMLENVLDANEAIGEYCEKYVNGDNLLTRAIFAGSVSRASTTYEKLPDTFKAAYDADETYMVRSREVWSATGKDAALPKVNFLFSEDGVSYTVAEDKQAEFEDTYRAAYERNVSAISGWDSMSDDEKLKALKSAHTKASNAAKKWYISQDD